MSDRDDTRRIDIDSLPELDTIVGMTGQMTQTEVGGQVCYEVGVLIITSMP